MKRTARCHCGSLVVYVSCEPEWVNVCHCIACQRRTGTVLHAGAYFPLAQVRIEGISTSYGRPADSGYEMSFRFCPVCGSNLYWHATRFPEHLGVAVGAFADPTFPRPSFSVWEESMHPWLGLPSGMQRFARGRVGRPLDAANSSD
jgi:hypothetical protein